MYQWTDPRLAWDPEHHENITELKFFPDQVRQILAMLAVNNRLACDLETIPIFHTHYHTHSGNASRPAADFLPTCCVLAG